MRSIQVAAAAALVAIGLIGPASAHDVTYESNVTLDGYGPKNRAITNYFTGKVKSPKEACEPDRTVKVFRADQGDDTPIGLSLSKSNGSWALGNDVVGPGKYYAKLRRRDIGASLHDHLCKGAKSGPLQLP